MHSGFKSFIRYEIFKDFSPSRRFLFLNSYQCFCLFFKSKVLHFGAAQFINLLFYGSWFWSYIAYKNLSPNPRSHRFSSILPEVLCFTFKFIIHLNLDFVAAGLRYVSMLFLFLQMDVQFFQYHLLKRLSFL